MENWILHSIVEKIVYGKKDWTAEELQYQRNYPDEVEKALHEFRNRAEALDKVSVIHYDSTVLHIRRIAARLGLWPKTISFPEAVALAVFESSPAVEETSVAILTIAGEVLDVALLVIGEGIFEVRHANCTSQISAEKIYHIWRDVWREVKSCEIKIDHLVIATNDYQRFQYENLVERLFGMKAEWYGNLHQLIQRGREIRAGVMTGEVKNVLLLSVIPQTIGIEMEGGLLLPIIVSNTTIPTRKSETVFLDAGVSEFSVDIWQGKDCYARENDLIGTVCLKNSFYQPGKQRELELTIDIDSTGGIGCRLTDKSCNVETEWISFKYA